MFAKLSLHVTVKERASMCYFELESSET